MSSRRERDDSTMQVERADDRAAIRATWADARDVLAELLHDLGVKPGRDAIRRVRFIGAGLSNVVYAANIRLGEGREDDVVVKLPARDATTDRDDRVRAEAALLRHLCGLPLPFRVPRPIREIETTIGLGVVQERVAGLEVDFRASRWPGGEPWEIVARVAAAVNAVDPAPLRELIRTHATRRDHALDLASILEQSDAPEARDTSAWMLEHLPPATPSRLLHGDLLGQNLRVGPDDEQIVVIDWAESLLSDPAYDLAIVTRGARKPFATADGLRRLLDAYNALAATPVTAREVHLYEVLFHAHLHDEATRQYGRGSPHAEQHRMTWRAVLQRASG